MISFIFDTAGARWQFKLNAEQLHLFTPTDVIVVVIIFTAVTSREH